MDITIAEDINMVGICGVEPGTEILRFSQTEILLSKKQRKDCMVGILLLSDGRDIRPVGGKMKIVGDRVLAERGASLQINPKGSISGKINVSMVGSSMNISRPTGEEQQQQWLDMERRIEKQRRRELKMAEKQRRLKEKEERRLNMQRKQDEMEARSEGDIVRGNMWIIQSYLATTSGGITSYSHGPVNVTTGISRRFERIDEGTGRIVPGFGRRILVEDGSPLTIDGAVLKDNGQSGASLEVSEDGSVRAGSGHLIYIN